MSYKLFSQYPDSSRIWIYAFNKILSDEDERLIARYMDPFIEKWKTHGKKVDGAYHILDQRFIVFAVSEADTVSGCSIDSSVRILEKLRSEHGLDALNFNQVFINTGGSVEAIPRYEFDPAHLEASTEVYNLTLQKLGDIRNGNFRKSLRDSWVAEIFSDR